MGKYNANYNITVFLLQFDNKTYSQTVTYVNCDNMYGDSTYFYVKYRVST